MQVNIDGEWLHSRGVLARPEAGASRCQSSSRELWQERERSLSCTASNPSHADVDRSQPLSSKCASECRGLRFTRVGSLGIEEQVVT